LCKLLQLLRLQVNLHITAPHASAPALHAPVPAHACLAHVLVLVEA